MADAHDLPDHGIPDAVAKPRSSRSLQLVWLVPLVAALAGGWLAVHAILKKGPSITITFSTAEGLEAGKTRLKYKDVEIGTVSSIELAEDRSGVVVHADMVKQSESLLTEDAKFWVVRPRISGSNVSGLGTLFSGAYIGVDAGQSTTEQRDFVGLDTPPVVTGGKPGQQFTLKSESLGSLDIGSPVYFRQIQVGQVVAYELDADGKGVTLRIFVNAPYDRFVKARTRFWNASGLDLALDSSGFRVNTESLVSILIGGVAFQNLTDTPDQPPEPNAAFNLFADRSSALRQPDTVIESMILVFRESVRGLAVGAPVDFRGITIGEVTAINIDFDREQKQFLIVVKADIYPQRLFSRYRKGATPAVERGHALVDTMISRGLRAQLRQGNLLTGQLYVALDFFPAERAKRAQPGHKANEIPTIPSSMTELQSTLANIAKKIEALPLQEVAGDLRQALQTFDKTLKEVEQLSGNLNAELAPEVRATLVEARKTLSTAQSVLSAESPMQQDLRSALIEVSRAAEALRTLAETLERQPESLLRGKKETAR